MFDEAALRDEDIRLISLSDAHPCRNSPWNFLCCRKCLTRQLWALRRYWWRPLLPGSPTLPSGSTANSSIRNGTFFLLFVRYFNKNDLWPFVCLLEFVFCHVLRLRIRIFIRSSEWLRIRRQRLLCFLRKWKGVTEYRCEKQTKQLLWICFSIILSQFLGIWL